MSRKRASEGGSGAVFLALRLLTLFLAASTLGLAASVVAVKKYRAPVLYAALAYTMVVNLLDIIPLLDRSRRIKRLHSAIMCLLDVGVLAFFAAAVHVSVNRFNDGPYDDSVLSDGPGRSSRLFWIAVCMSGGVCLLHLIFAISDCVFAFRQPKGHVEQYRMVPSAYAQQPPPPQGYMPAGPPPGQPMRFGQSYY